MDKERFRAYAAVYCEDTPRQQVIEELTSISHESRNLCDPFVLIFTPEGLYAPTHKCLVKKKVDTSTPLGMADYGALIKLEEIVARETSGTVLWLSPPYGKDEAAKVIGYEIYAVNGKKIIFGHSVLLPGMGGEQLRKIGNFVARRAGEDSRQTAMDLRRAPIFLKKGPVHWTYVLSEFAYSENWVEIRSGTDWVRKNETLKEVSRLYKDMFPQGAGSGFREPPEINSDLFGKNPLSCPPKDTAFDFMFKLGEETWSGNCPLCGVYNEGLKPGDKCKGCGEVYEGCGTELGPINHL